MIHCDASVYHRVRCSKVHKRQGIGTPASSYLPLQPLQRVLNFLLAAGAKGFARLKCLVLQELPNLLNVGCYGGHVWIHRDGTFEPFERLTGFLQAEIT
jgi:hypothetical protein